MKRILNERDAAELLEALEYVFRPNISVSFPYPHDVCRLLLDSCVNKLRSLSLLTCFSSDEFRFLYLVMSEYTARMELIDCPVAAELCILRDKIGHFAP